jgi:hypothetical protein
MPTPAFFTVAALARVLDLDLAKLAGDAAVVDETGLAS